MNPEAVYREYLEAIERIARSVARRHRLSRDEAAEFEQQVHVRLRADDYALIREFDDRSKFTTYLQTVISQMYHRYRLGQWRPSEARRLGVDATEQVEASLREQTARKAAQVLNDLIEQLDGEDRLILTMRFREARKVPDIANALRIDQKKIFKRLDKLFAMMRRELERSGVRDEEIGRLLAGGDEEIGLALFDRQV